MCDLGRHIATEAHCITQRFMMMTLDRSSLGERVTRSRKRHGGGTPGYEVLEAPFFGPAYEERHTVLE